MSILLFIIVLGVLIFVHELGHFIAAKMSGVRVDEFGIGFPPKIVGYKPKNGETLYSLNLFPVGGFVKIFGEDPNDESISGPDSSRSFVNKSKWLQVWMLSAGVIFNVLLGWLLLSFGLMSGLPTSTAYEGPGEVSDVSVVVTTVIPDSPAEHAGLSSGDRITSLSDSSSTLFGEDLTADSLSEFINNSSGGQISVTYGRGADVETIEVFPVTGVVENRYAIGISLDEIGTLRLPLHLALWEGGKLTGNLTVAIGIGLWDFFSDAFVGAADLEQVAGPVGLVGLVSDASAHGFIYLLSFAAFFSINLALINLVPFPALDGGRILFVAIEAIKGSPINPRIANGLNLVGFSLLILLMVIVTYNDIVRLVTG